MKKTVYTSAGAVNSTSGEYRYLLWREWRGYGEPENYGDFEPKPCVFILLNPSMAGNKQDDRMIQRCVRFAQMWGFDRMEIVYLFGHRTENPHELLRLNHDDDPVGWDNQRHFQDAVGENCGKIVCAWGNFGRHIDQDQTASGWLAHEREPECLGMSPMTGCPYNPVSVSYETKLIPFKPVWRFC